MPPSPTGPSVVLLNIVVGRSFLLSLSSSSRHLDKPHGSRELSISLSAQRRRYSILSLRGDVLQAGSRSRGSLPVFQTPFGKHKLDRTLPSFLEEAFHDPSRLIKRIK
jgi:hypothetical protein